MRKRNPPLVVIFIFLLMTTGCSRVRLHDFKLGHHKVKTEGRMHPNYRETQKQIYVAPMDPKTDRTSPNFKLFANYIYAAMEERGHKRTYNPRKANMVVLFESSRSGPHKIQRTAVNHFWTNYSPFISTLFLDTKTDTEATYDFLKQRRDIKEWKEEKDAFNFYYYVYLTRIRIRAIEYITDQEPRIAWENTVTVMGQKKRYASGFIAGIAASFEHWEEDLDKPRYTELLHTDRKIFALYEKVFAENAYQTAETHQRFREDYRTLKNEEIIKYYLRREKQYDLNPLYEPEQGVIIPIIEESKLKKKDDGYFRN